MESSLSLSSTCCDELFFEEIIMTTEELLTGMTAETNHPVMVEQRSHHTTTTPRLLLLSSPLAAVAAMESSSSSSSPFRLLDDATTTMAMTTIETEPGVANEEQDDMEDLSTLTNDMNNNSTTALFLDVNSTTTFPLPDGGEFHSRDNSLEGSSASLPPPLPPWPSNTTKTDESTTKPLWGQKRVRNQLIATTGSVMTTTTTTGSVMKKKKKPRMVLDQCLDPESQQMLMNEPIEHDDDDPLINAGHHHHDHGLLLGTTDPATTPAAAAASLPRRQQQQRLASHKAAFGVARKDIFDNDDDDAGEHDDHHYGGGGGAPTTGGDHHQAASQLLLWPAAEEPRVGLDSWQMHVVHRMIQKLPRQHQAAFQSIAARAIDRHIQGEVKYDHLPGSIFEDVMAAAGATGTEQYAELFLEIYIAVRNEMHQLENVHNAAALMMVPPRPVKKTISSIQLAMGYAYVLGMRHAQTRSVESALDDSLLDRAKAQMNDVPPSERGRVWSEFVALANNYCAGDSSVAVDDNDGILR